jgi:hypothetical protein
VGAFLRLIAHGGTAGLVTEIVVALGVIALAVSAWVHSRRGL